MLGFAEEAGAGNTGHADLAHEPFGGLGPLDIQPGALLRLCNPNNLTAWADGDTFKLFDWSCLTSVSGEFEIDSSELNLLSDFRLDTTQLYTFGTVTLIVPEPSRAVLVALGFSLVQLRRRRS